MKKIIAMLLMLAVIGGCFAAAEQAPVAYTYTFEVGEALEGDGLKPVRELMDALSFRLTRQEGTAANLYYIELLSNGDIVLSLTARDSASGEYGLQCSLTGKDVFLCRKDQLGNFLGTLVQVLADLRILKGESLEKVQGLAVKAGGILENLTAETDGKADAGIDLTPYLDRLIAAATETETLTGDGIPADAPSGTVTVRRYLLSREDLIALTDRALKAVCSIPVLSDELKSGHLKLGNQIITDDFLRNLVSALNGDTELFLYEEADGRLLGLSLKTPDMSGIPAVQGTALSGLKGLALVIDRREEKGENISDTSIRLLGLDQDLVKIRLVKGMGKQVQDLPDKNTHQVGELDSRELLELISGMSLTIIWNAGNAILSLPRCIFDLLIGKFF